MNLFRRYSATVFSLVFVFVTATLTAGLVNGFGAVESRWVWIGAWFLVCNVTTCLAFGIDKWLAGNGGFRIPETTLWFAALIGGSIGAAAGMRAFRHKSAKTSFRTVFFAIIALQVLAIAIVALLTMR
jgi:uncharacterized membrane protein YsdA (DUF1294 family)